MWQAAKAEGGGAAEPGAILRLSREFQNAHVEHRPWRAVCFSQDMEYAAAGTDDHRVYFWSLVGANLEKILEFDGGQPSSTPHCRPVLIMQNSPGNTQA